MVRASSGSLPAAVKMRSVMPRSSAWSITVIGVVLPSISVAGRGGNAQRVGGVDAEDLDLAREEGELLERKRQGAVLGMGLDIGVELRRRKGTADHVALELGHVDAIGGKPAQRLIERRRHIADAEQKGRHGRRAARRLPGLTRQDQKAGRVVLGVLDVLLQRDKAIDLAGELGGDRCDRWVAAGGDLG